jgi:hypothetical protein
LAAAAGTANASNVTRKTREIRWGIKVTIAVIVLSAIGIIAWPHRVTLKRSKGKSSMTYDDDTLLETVTFRTKDLRVRIQGLVVYIDQRSLVGDQWRQIEQSGLPLSEQWLDSPMRSSPLKIALWAYEQENPGDMALRSALRG